MKNFVVFTVLIFYLAGVISQGIPEAILNESCIKCICHASSSCENSAFCNGDVCGPFRITRAYWIDGGQPTLNNEHPNSPLAYEHCASDFKCATLAVQGYMRKFYQDCNGDNVIDCNDYVLIHEFGGYGCKGRTLYGLYRERFTQCNV
ncbi:hypothetical protein HHI36_013905 [Cryptolaemus montrouzieri]|uniref:lysozyme n=1 Tax=Cryptolaemus montrouzieri TaxID=559131 RepID=A0ABD2N144_9CUCU